jgi:hypothetical protein
MSVTNYDNVRLLLPFSGTNNGTTFTSLSSDNYTIAVSGNTKTVTAESNFYGSSAYFDGSGDYLTIANGLSQAVGTSDFTIELWAKLNTTSSVTFLDFRPNSTNGAYITLSTSAQKLNYTANSAIVITGSTTLGTTDWMHIALCRSGTSTKLFLNGTQEGSTYTDSTTYLNNRLTIGQIHWQFYSTCKTGRINIRHDQGRH